MDVQESDALRIAVQALRWIAEYEKNEDALLERFESCGNDEFHTDARFSARMAAIEQERLRAELAACNREARSGCKCRFNDNPGGRG